MPVHIHHRKSQTALATPVRRALAKVLEKIASGGIFLEVTFVGLKEIERLNFRYLKHRGVTDVLSFPLDTKRPKAARPWHLGEVVIAVPVAKRQARRAGRRDRDQVLRLAIHGLVHLLGQDHTRGEAARRRFEREEKKYLTELSRKRLMRWDGLLQF